MDTSYVAVGTVIYMITDSLTCRPQEKPRRSGANSAQPSHLAVEFAERVMNTLGDRDPAEQRQ